MVNSEEFGSRLQKIMEYYDISAATFADAIEVGRSSISHILSGRNKPSLDFVLKIIKSYPEVELYWLLNGKGEFPSAGKNPPTPDASVPPPGDLSKDSVDSVDSDQTNIQKESSPSSNSFVKTTKGKAIQKIVIFYKDGTFDAFEN